MAELKPSLLSPQAFAIFALCITAIVAQDAKTHVWRDNEDTVRWSEEFHNRAMELIRQNQFPSDCSTKKVTFITALMGGVIMNRTVIQDSTLSHGGNSRFHGCDVANFRCFFQGIWGETCMEAWTKERLESQVMVKSLLDSDAKITVLPDCYTPGVTLDHQLQWLQRVAGHDLPQLSRREVSFMIMALGVGYMKPQKAILDAAQNLPMVPTLMAHIRRSDKAVDVPTFYENHSKFLPTKVFAHCLASIIEKNPNVKYQRVHVMSDSDVAYAEIKEYIQQAGGRTGGYRRLSGKPETNSSTIPCFDKPCMEYPLENLSQVMMTDYGNAFEQLLDHNTLRKFHLVGHTALPGKYAKRFYELVLTDVYSAALAPEFRACVTYSSNVGRFILEYAGHKHRAVQLGFSGPLGVSLDKQWASNYCNGRE